MDEHSVRLERYEGPWPDDDRDANFKTAVVEWTVQDPMPTFAMLSRNTGVPVGALIRYALVRWAAEGSEALMFLGPRNVERLWAVVREAQEVGTDEAKLVAFDQLAQMLSWLRVPLEPDPPASM